MRHTKDRGIYRSSGKGGALYPHRHDNVDIALGYGRRYYARGELILEFYARVFFRDSLKRVNEIPCVKGYLDIIAVVIYVYFVRGVSGVQGLRTKPSASFS